MTRDPEAERYELQAHRERQDALGRALYERRRPDAPKAWAELDEQAQTQWILIAVDQGRAQGTEPEVLLELESRLGPNPLSADDPPNVHDPELPSERARRLFEEQQARAADQPPVDTEQDEFDVAVVVFCRARGADESDAADRASGVTRQILRDSESMEPLPGRSVVAVDVIPLNRALVAGYVAARPSARAYKNAGMGGPRKKDQ